MRESVSSDDWICNHEVIASSSSAYDVIRSPDVTQVMTVNKIPEIACVCRRVGAGEVFCSHVGASNDAFDRPGGRFDN